MERLGTIATTLSERNGTERNASDRNGTDHATLLGLRAGAQPLAAGACRGSGLGLRSPDLTSHLPTLVAKRPIAKPWVELRVLQYLPKVTLGSFVTVDLDVPTAQPLTVMGSTECGHDAASIGSTASAMPVNAQLLNSSGCDGLARGTHGTHRHTDSCTTFQCVPQACAVVCTIVHTSRVDSSPAGGGQKSSF